MLTLLSSPASARAAFVFVAHLVLHSPLAPLSSTPINRESLLKETVR